MGCNSCNNRGNVGNAEDFRNEDCVADVVRGIVRAQRRAIEAEDDTCFTGCDRSIEELLSPFEENRSRLRHNTIPFMLICKENCRPFVGVGIRRERDGRSEHHNFKCVESPVFRAKSFVNDSENCVRLELLTPVREHHRHDDHNHGENHEHEGHKKDKCHDDDFCDFLPRNTRNFRATGICITVDLNCFCGITCLDPISPLRARGLNELV